jgi:hypothetical protein
LLQAQSSTQAASCDAHPFSMHDQHAQSGGGAFVSRLGPGEHAPLSSRSLSPTLPDEEPPDEPLDVTLPDEEPEEDVPDEEPASRVDPVRPSLCSASS